MAVCKSVSLMIYEMADKEFPRSRERFWRAQTRRNASRSSRSESPLIEYFNLGQKKTEMVSVIASNEWTGFDRGCL